MIRLILEKRHVNEGYGKPCEGIFWYIGNKLITYMDPVSFNTTLEHKDIWQGIRQLYGDRQYDYYPRGRVMVNPVVDDNGVTVKYKAFIYIDNCINNEEIIDTVKYQFNIGDCEIVYIGSDGGVTSNHYKCHNCK